MWGDEEIGQIAWAKAVETYHTVILSSGNMLGKSVFTSQYVIPWFALTHPGSITVITATSQSNIAEITWPGLRRALEGYTSPQGVLHKPIIPIDAKFTSGSASPATVTLPNGSRIIGLSTTSTERLSGLHAPDLLCVVEEASGVADEIWNAIDGLGVSNLLVVGNPLRQDTGFHRLFKQGQMDAKAGIPPHQAIKSIQIPSTSSPHIHLERSPWGIADATWLETQRRTRGEHSLFWMSHVLAEFPEVNSETLIPQEHLARATSEESGRFAAEMRKRGRGGKIRIACDVGEGRNAARSVVLVLDDVGFIELIASKTMGVGDTASQIATLAAKYQVGNDYISFDAAGLSGPRMKAALQSRGIQAVEYMGGHSTSGWGKQYTNMRTAAAASFARRLDPSAFLPGLEKDTRFHIPVCPEIGEILEELGELRGMLKGDKYGLEDKHDMAARIHRSPDYADCITQGFWRAARTGVYAG